MKRLLEIGQRYANIEAVDQKLEEYRIFLDAPLDPHYRRFLGGAEQKTKFYEELGNIHEFFENRYSAVLEEIQETFPEMELED